MPNDEFHRWDHACCEFCNIMQPTKCPPEYQMSVLMIEKCPGFTAAYGLTGYFDSYKLEVPEDVK